MSMTAGRTIPVSTTIAPPVTIDPMVQEYAPYVDIDGKIRFIAIIEQYGGRQTQRWFTYDVAKRELWRTYVRTKRNWKRVYTSSFSSPLSYIRMYRLVPVWPKYMQLDKGL